MRHLADHDFVSRTRHWDGALWCPSVDDVTVGERRVERLRLLSDAVRSRPVTVVAVLMAVGSLASAVPSLHNASTFPGLSFDYWVLDASVGFGTPMQLGLVLTAVLLLIDRQSGAHPGQRALFASLAALGGIGVVANLAGVITALSIGLGKGVAVQNAEERAVLVLHFLAPAALAALTCWVGRVGGRMVKASEGDER
jgi:hypothetical protein